MRYGRTGEIDRVTSWQEANSLQPRLALAGGVLAITCPFPPFQLSVEEGKDGKAVAGNRGGKGRRQEDVCMYVYIQRWGGGMSKGTGSKLRYGGVEEVQMEGGKFCHGCSIAHRHKHLAIDRVSPRLDMSHIHFLFGSFRICIKYTVYFAWLSWMDF